MSARRLAVLIFLIMPFALAKPVSAAISSCTASVSPGTTTTSTLQNFTFSVTNSDSNAIRWIKLTKPSSNFTLGGYSIQGGWSVNSSSDALTLTGGTVAAGASFGFLVQAQTGGSEAGSANWTLEVSDDGGGASAFSCSGSLGTAISGNPPDTTPPTISNVVITDVLSTSVRVTWSTDEAATSVVDYGPTDGYGSNTSDSSLTTTHSVSLTGLTANTSYHFSLTSADAAGNTVTSEDATFSTAQTGTTGSTQTITVTTTTTTTVTKVVTPSATPTPTPDSTPPTLTLVTKLEKSYQKAPTLQGKASDVSSVASVDYSTDGGKNWTPIEDRNLGKTSVSFTYIPQVTEDGSYIVKLRAVDGKGNTGYSKVDTLTIDRLPPQVGNTFLTFGPNILTPTAGERVVTVAGLPLKLTVSAIGGPLSVDVRSGSETFQLSKNADSGLWSGTFAPTQPGQFELIAHAVDGVNNQTTRTIGSLEVLAGGVVRAGGESGVGETRMTAYYQDPVTRAFVRWDGQAFGQKNPLEVTPAGMYTVFLPPSTYYLEITSPKFQTVRTSIFTLQKPTPITQSFDLTLKRVYKLGPFTIPLPDFRYSYKEIVFPESATEDTGASQLVGSPFPDFSLNHGEETITNVSFRGTPTVVAFLPTWSPTTADQLEVLTGVAHDKNIRVAVFVPHETPSAVATFTKRGGYGLDMIADPDGKLVDKLQLAFAPTLIALDRRGVIRAVLVGHAGKGDIMTIVSK